MYIAIIQLNLVYSSGEKVRYGPYSFPDWERRKAWERRFKRSLTKMSTEIPSEVLQSRKIMPEFLIGQRVAERDVMDAPEPAETVRMLRVLLERGVVGFPPG